MNARVRGLALLLVLTSVAGCRGQRRAAIPGPHARPAGTSPRRPPNPNVFAADGMCADRLVRQHADLLRLHGGILNTLEDRLHAYKTARARIRHSIYLPDRVRENRAADKLKQTWAFWRDIRTPYDARYGEYVCLRRQDLRPLSSAEFARGMDEVWDTIRHLGPLPSPQNFEIGD